MALRTFLVAALVGLIPSSSQAQSPARDQSQPPIKHDVVVTATRLEAPEKKVGSSLTVVSGEELTRTGKAFVLDALEAALDGAEQETALDETEQRMIAGLDRIAKEIRSVRCSDCASCAIQCPNGVDVRNRLMRAQELLV